MNNKKYPNLKSWQPGQSGNPAGRKPGSKNISTIVQELLDEEANADVLARSNVAELVKDMPTSYAQSCRLGHYSEGTQRGYASYYLACRTAGIRLCAA